MPITDYYLSGYGTMYTDTFLHHNKGLHKRYIIVHWIYLQVVEVTNLAKTAATPLQLLTGSVLTSPPGHPSPTHVSLSPPVDLHTSAFHHVIILSSAVCLLLMQ